MIVEKSSIPVKNKISLFIYASSFLDNFTTRKNKLRDYNRPQIRNLPEWILNDVESAVSHKLKPVGKILAGANSSMDTRKQYFRFTLKPVYKRLDGINSLNAPDCEISL